MKYTFDNILEMFGGFQYYSKEHLLYIFHKVNGDEEQANYYYQLLQEENNKINELNNQLKTEEEIKEISNANT